MTKETNTVLPNGVDLKCAEDFTDADGNQYRKGKFLKGINYKEPVFASI